MLIFYPETFLKSFITFNLLSAKCNSSVFNISDNEGLEELLAAIEECLQSQMAYLKSVFYQNLLQELDKKDCRHHTIKATYFVLSRQQLVVGRSEA